MRKSLFLTITLAVPVLLFTSCQLDVPIKEMVAARKAISRAYEVKADKYAPDQLKKAEDELYQSHEFCKKEDVDKGREQATASKKDADSAIETALPLLAADTLEQAKKTLAEAEKLYAEKYAAEDYEKAKTLLTESDILNTNREYWNSYIKALNSISSSQNAIDASKQQIPAVTALAASLREEAATLKNGETDEAILKDISDAGAFLESADSLISDENLKEASSRIDDARKKLSAVKTAKEKNRLTARIATLRQEMDKLKNERGAEFAAEDIETVAALLNEAESSIQQDDLNTASGKTDEAEEKLGYAGNKTLEGIAAEKIASVNQLKESIAAKDSGNRFQNELNAASEKLAQSRALLDRKSYGESIEKATEAETDLNALSITVETAYMAKKEPEKETSDGKKPTMGGEGIYVVQYHKKNTDCLWRISLKVYRDARLWPRIYMANRQQIKDPDLIFPGQRFIIPPLEKEQKPVDIKAGEKKADEATRKTGETMDKPAPDENTDTEKSNGDTKVETSVPEKDEDNADVPEGIFPDNR